MRLTIALAAAALLALPSAAGAVVPQGNIVVNPGAEAGPGATNVTDKPSLPGWSTTGSMTAVRYGAVDFPTLEDGSRAAGDSNFFAGGPGSASASAQQTIDVSAAAPEIDGGNLGWNLSAFIGGFSSQGDNATVTVDFLDGAGNAFGFRTIGPVTPQDRGDVTGLLSRSAFGTVPPGSRGIRISLIATRSNGSYNDGYVDNVAMTLGPPPPAPTFAKTVEATPVSGAVFARLPGSKRFVPIASVESLPVGSIVDARKGRVRLRASDGKAGFSFADFYQGQFKLLQDKRDEGIVRLDLFGGNFKRCGRGGIAAGKKNKSVRHLWGQGSGKFRTAGRFASATLRGTTWLTDDQCGGTLVRVTVGTVAVRDLPRKRDVTVTAPKRYFAKARR